MGMEMISNFNEFNSAEMDIHITNSSEDTMLHQELKGLAQAAIQNGQAKIHDLIAIAQSESVQETARKLKNSSEEILEEQREKEKADRESNERMQQAGLAAAEKVAEREDYHKNEDRKVEYAKIDSSLESIAMKEMGGTIRDDNKFRVDTDKNGIDDRIDLERTEIQRTHNEDSISVKREQLAETKRSNMANESLKKQSLNKSTVTKK